MDKINIDLSNAYISLLKGIVIKENKEKIWDTILNYRNQIEDYFRHLGLKLRIYEEEGYCYLQQDEDEELKDLFKLVPKVQLRVFILVYFSQLLENICMKVQQMVMKKLLFQKKKYF